MSEFYEQATKQAQEFFSEPKVIVPPSRIMLHDGVSERHTGDYLAIFKGCPSGSVDSRLARFLVVSSAHGSEDFSVGDSRVRHPSYNSYTGGRGSWTIRTDEGVVSIPSERDAANSAVPHLGECALQPLPVPEVSAVHPGAEAA